MSALAAFALFAQTAAFAMPPTPPADLVDIVDDAAARRGDRTPVLVLGTEHLPRDTDPRRFEPLVEKLVVWAPQAVAVESIAGPQCDYLRAYDFLSPGTAETYCPDPSDARAALRLDGPQALQEALAILDRPDDERDFAARRRLALLFLAIGEPESAQVQWLRLPVEERVTDGALDEALVARLNDPALTKGENAIIAVPVAVRLGLDRVHRVDDQASGAPIADLDLYRDEITAIWDNPATKARLAADEAAREAFYSGGLPVLDWYRRLSSDEALAPAMEGDFGAAAGASTPGNSGRQYFAYWETRNLRMVANIRRVVGDGTRTLAIVGVSHVPYYKRYLGMTSDIEIADLDTVLAD